MPSGACHAPKGPVGILKVALRAVGVVTVVIGGAGVVKEGGRVEGRVNQRADHCLREPVVEASKGRHRDTGRRQHRVHNAAPGEDQRGGGGGGGVQG